MQKTRKSNSLVGPQRPRHNSIPTPEVMNMDVMAVAKDEDLFNTLRTLEDDRQKVIASGDDSTAWEVELAYIKRELQIRRERRTAYEKYMKQLEKEYAEEEANLPVADLDNSYFLRLVGELN